MGKTTLLFQLLQQLQNSARTVFLFQTLCGPEDLLRSILHDLGTEARGEDVAAMHSRLNEHVLAESRRGRRLVVVIDEAQNLTDSALELLRMLSNFERPGEKLMQIILAGQPQLADKLASPDLVQLRQRISIVARLKPFELEDVNLYVGHRLRVAGYDFARPLFTPGAGALIAKHCEGIPRNINNLCFNALSLGYALKRKPIDEAVIQEVIDDLDLSSIKQEAALPSRRKPAFGNSKAALGAWATAYGAPSTFRFAAAAMFALTLFWSLTAGEHIQKAWAAQRPLILTKAISASSPSVSESRPELSTLAAPTLNATKPVSAADASSKSLVGSRLATPIPRQDPAELWKQVRRENTSAELALANLYLEGTMVPQNCLQARVLMSAASKKGKSAPESLMATYSERCE
jgi:type II secretory pathway predicted ATPase ExeA